MSDELFPRFAITPARRLDQGKRVGYDLFLVTEHEDIPALWLTYLGWSRTLEGVLTMRAQAQTDAATPPGAEEEEA